MIESAKISQLHRALTRIFSLPIGRCTFREIQNIILTTVDNKGEVANALLETLLTGDLNAEKAKQFPATEMKKIIDDYSISTWVAKDVFEKGDFVSLVTSDAVNAPGHYVFANRIKRVDGEEFHFVTDAESTLQVFLHFAGRVQELSKIDSAKKILNDFKKELSSVKSKIETVIQS